MSQDNPNSTRNLQFNYVNYQNRNKNLQKSKIDKYYIFQKLGGTGQFGTVYRGMDGLNKKQVALKILDKRSTENQTSLNKKKLKKRLIQDQSQIMQKVNSQNVLKCYECLENRDLKIMIIQYCNNGSLYDLISERGRLPEDQAVTLFKQVINGVAECHKQKIIHRDLKLQNILIHNGECKIADFGFSKVLKINNQAQTIKSSILGSLLTMAPQVMLKKKYGLKADIWSLGVIFFQLIFGKNPFRFEGNDIEKCLEKGVHMINSQEEYNEVKTSAQAKKFIRQVLVIDQQKRLGWRQVLNHQLFKVQRPALPTRFYRRVQLKNNDSQLENMEKQIFKDNNSALCNSGIIETKQLQVQSPQKPISQPETNQENTPVTIKNQKIQTDTHSKHQSSQFTQKTLQQKTHNSNKLQKQTKFTSSKTQIQPEQQKQLSQKQNDINKKDNSIPKPSSFTNSPKKDNNIFQQQNKIAQNLLKSSQVLKKDDNQNQKLNKQEVKCQTKVQNPLKKQVKTFKKQEVKENKDIIRDEVRQQFNNKLDKFSLTDQEMDKAHNEINREDQQIYKWAQRIHTECLRAQFIFNNIVKVIEKYRLLDQNERDSIELMYLICTRCRNNISPIYNEYAKRKHNKIIQDLKVLVEPLYRMITGKWNAYCTQLTKKENQKIVMFTDFFSKRLSKDFKKKDRFLTAIQSMEEFRPSNAPKKTVVKVGDKTIKQENLVDYTKQQQIQFTNQCMQKAIPNLKFLESNKELRITMKNFRNICLLKAQGLKPETFRLKLKEESLKQ